MDTESEKEYWLKIAREDWDMAQHLFEHERHVYALFFIHLFLEKTLKAVVVANTSQKPSYTHNLLKLVKEAKIEIDDNQAGFLNQVNYYQIESRYPDYKRSIHKIATKEFTRMTLTKAEEIRKWLLKKMK